MREQVIDLIRQSGLTRVAAQIEGYVKDSIRLIPEKTNEENLKIGVTKIGGHPDLPPEIQWPSWNNIPQSFIAQLRLADFIDFDFAAQLPQNGWLYFFYDAEQSVIGIDPKDRGGWSVHYFDGNESVLARREFPTNLPVHSQFNACHVKRLAEPTIPSSDSIYIEQLELTHEERELYWALYDQVHELHRKRNGALHRILGYPDPVQGDVHYECQLAFNGLDVGEAKSYTDPIAAKLNPARKEWQLLLQIDSDQQAGMMWGDVGSIYFSMQSRDLEQKRFEQAWFTFQCS